MTLRKTLLIGCLALITAGAADAAITRVSKRLGFVEFYAGYAKPVGTLDGLPTNAILNEDDIVEFDAEDVFGSTAAFAFRIGQLSGEHTQLSLGVQYMDLKYSENPFEDDYRFDAFDFDLDLNFRFAGFRQSDFSPYAGLGAFAGFVRGHGPGFDSEYIGTLGLTANFGAEIKLLEGSGGGILTLLSANDYQFMVTNDRPRYLNIGGALRYYFLP